MNQLHRDLADKLHRDATHLIHAIEADEAEIALSTAKRVRRTSTLLVRQIAATRDHATAQEGTST